jgi:hypothetical protein
MEKIYPVCPFSVIVSFCYSTFHSLIVLSKLLDAKHVLSGEKTTEVTYRVCPSRVFNSFFNSILHSFTVVS